MEQKKGVWTDPQAVSHGSALTQPVHETAMPASQDIVCVLLPCVAFKAMSDKKTKKKQRCQATPDRCLRSPGTGVTAARCPLHTTCYKGKPV